MRYTSLCWALNQGARFGWSLSANYISLVITVCKLDLQSLTLCDCFINKIVQLYITSEIERRARQWTQRWADKKRKKRELVFKVGLREKTKKKPFPEQLAVIYGGANMRDLFSGAKICPLALIAISMRFRIFFPYASAERTSAGVQLNTISKPIKGCIRITAMYLLLWDITLRVLQLQSGGSKFHWLERWGAIETKKKKAKEKKKKPSVQKWRQPHNSHRVEHPRCVVRGWSFKHP